MHQCSSSVRTQYQPETARYTLCQVSDTFSVQFSSGKTRWTIRSQKATIERHSTPDRVEFECNTLERLDQIKWRQIGVVGNREGSSFPGWNTGRRCYLGVRLFPHPVLPLLPCLGITLSLAILTMLSSISRAPRFSVTTCILIAAGVSLLLVLFAYFSDSLKAPLEYAHGKAGEYWDKTFKPSTQVYNCEDPYRRPGYLYIPADINGTDQYKKTRWIPYTDDLLEAEDPDYAVYPAAGEIVFNATEVESEYVDLSSTPRQWMPAVVAESQRRRKAAQYMKTAGVEDYAPMKNEGELGWLWGRRILLFSDSVDRFMMEFFCKELGRGMQQPAPHTTATCTVPEFNLTFVHWHFAGSFTYRPDWWWMTDMKAIAFEDRWEQYWGPMNKTIQGPNGYPDLILWQSGLWDQRAFWESGEANHEKDVYPMGTRVRQLVWQEVRFTAARLRKFVGRIALEFPKSPTMFRSMTIHRVSDAGDATIYDLDRLSRAIAEKAGHEVFEWGRIITSLSMLYKDKTHPGRGPASWLWADMVLEYLARGGGVGDEQRKPYFDSWDACHPHLMNWGGR